MKLRALPGRCSRGPLSLGRLLLAAILTAHASARSAEELRFENVSLEDGLSHSMIWDVQRDSRGFLWIATQSHLHRYDGYTYKAYKHDPDDSDSISANEVVMIYEDRRGVLWFGTRDGGLNRYDRVEDRFIRYLPDAAEPDRLAPGLISFLLEDHEGALWVGVEAGGLHRLDRDSDTFTRYVHDPNDPSSLSNNTVVHLLEDGSRRLWVATIGGLERFDSERGRFVHYPYDPEDARFQSSTVSALYQDSDSVLWAGTLDGKLFNFEGAVAEDAGSVVLRPSRVMDVSGRLITSIREDRDGALWIATFGGGLSRLDRSAPDSESAALTHFHHDPDVPDSLASDTIRTIHVDSSGVLWAATVGGLSKLDPHRKRFMTLRHRPGTEAALPGPHVTTLSEDGDGILWAGTQGGGLVALDRARGDRVLFRHEPGGPAGLPRSPVEVVQEDRQGRVWIGTRAGLGQLLRPPGRTARFEPEPSFAGVSLLCVLQDASGDLWFGASSGLHHLDVETGRFTKYADDPGRPGRGPANVVLGLVQDRSGILWLATGGGLARFDPVSGSFSRYFHNADDPNSLSSNYLTSVYLDPSGTFWIGTTGNGLNRWNPAGEEGRGRWRRYREKDGLASDSVAAIVAGDDGDLWISTSGGLSRFEPETETFRSYDAGDGLHGDVFLSGAALRSASGELLFGGSGGLTAFRPGQIEDDPRVPPVVLTELRLAGEPVSLKRRDPGSPLERSMTETREIVLPHEHKSFDIEFAALHFASSQKIRYAYRLDGYDESWITTDASLRRARYTNLDPQTYVFRVKASNPDGVWNEEGTSVRLTLLPPPWRTRWAYALYALAAAAVVTAYVRSHRKQLRAEREAVLRERAVADRERAASRRLRAIDKLKDELLASTSHEFRTPLYGITGLAESLIDGATGELPEATKQNLALIVSSGRRLSHLVDDVLDLSKLRHRDLELDLRPVDLRPLVEVVRILSQPLVGSKNLELINEAPSGLPAVEADENRLQQILHNLVGNAVKFTESGTVKVSAAVDGDRIVVDVADTGIGISEEQQKRIFEPFEQAEASIAGDFGGTGLGLSITRQLVELHDGRIWVESRPAEGSTFSFSLPIAAAQVGEPTGPVAAKTALEGPAAQGIADLPPSCEPAEASEPGAEGARILVVDDEPVNRQVLRNHLANHGYRLTLASSGDETLRLLREQSFDLVLLDIMMPKVSGYEVCRALRKIHPLEELPVIFLTAKNQASDVVAGLSLGANDYLTKPINKDELLARIRPHLDMLRLHRNLEELVEEKVSQIKVLSGLLPICSVCKKIRDDEGFWSQLEIFIDRHSEAEFTHGICPDCVKKHYADLEPDDA